MDAAGAESPTRSSFQFGFLVKFFSKKEHADAFRDGLLYSRKLKHFREDHDDPLRRDKHEGAILLEGGQLSMQVDNQWIPVETVGPLQINYHVLDQLNIFCMTILRSSFARGPSPALLGEIFDQIRDSLPTCIEMGRHAVMVYDPVRFFKQVSKKWFKFNQDRTICHSYRWTISDSVVSQLPERRSRWAGLPTNSEEA